VSLSSALSTRTLSHRGAKLGSGGFHFPPQYVGSVPEQAALLEKFLCELARLSYFLPQLLWNRRTSEKVRTNALGQILMAMETEIPAGIEGHKDQFVLPEALSTRGALGHAVVPAIDVDEDRLFRAQTTR